MKYAGMIKQSLVDYPGEIAAVLFTRGCNLRCPFCHNPDLLIKPKIMVKPTDIDSKVGSIGLPEFGTRFVRQMLEETQPQTFSDLVRISGLSHGENVWLNNAQELIAAGKCHIGQVVATRDDIMTFLIYRGLAPKLSFGIMEHVRKGKGLSEEEIAAMRSGGVPDWFVDSCLKIRYLFPKAHAVAYVTMAFRIAYFKVHHPLAFYVTYFTVRADEFDSGLVQGGVAAVKARMVEIEHKGNDATARDKNIVTILEVIIEAMARGIKFLGVDLYKSDARKFLTVGDDSLLIPLASLPGLGTSAAQAIEAARVDGVFTSVEDLRGRSKISKTVIDVMREYGILEGLPETDQMTLF
jgi:DNA polymerase-3 subunit alpha (Gram-positive type)